MGQNPGRTKNERFFNHPRLNAQGFHHEFYFGNQVEKKLLHPVEFHVDADVCFVANDHGRSPTSRANAVLGAVDFRVDGQAQNDGTFHHRVFHFARDFEGERNVFGHVPDGQFAVRNKILVRCFLERGGNESHVRVLLRIEEVSGLQVLVPLAVARVDARNGDGKRDLAALQVGRVEVESPVEFGELAGDGREKVVDGEIDRGVRLVNFPHRGVLGVCRKHADCGQEDRQTDFFDCRNHFCKKFEL